MSIQPDTHSFIVKIWFEEVNGPRAAPAWRGRVTHVPSGHMCSFTDMNEIAAFIAPYLAQAGSPVRRRRKIVRWLRMWQTRLRNRDK